MLYLTVCVLSVPSCIMCILCITSYTLYTNIILYNNAVYCVQFSISLTDCQVIVIAR